MTTTAQSEFATTAQKSYIASLRQQKGEAAFARIIADLGCDSDPTHIRKRTASKLIDALLDEPTAPVVTAAASIPAPVAAPVQATAKVAVEPVEIPQAKVDTSDLTGKEFAVSVADGYAYYSVQSDMGGFCTVVSQHRDHSYDCPVLGERAVISRDNIVRLVSV